MFKKHSAGKVFLGLLLVVLLGSPLAADEKTDKVDKLFAQWDTTTTPGAALAVIQDGRIVYERGYGMARIEDNIVMTPRKIFDIGSVSKQFTAACLAILIRQGKVGMEDDIRKYLPEMSRYEQPRGSGTSSTTPAASATTTGCSSWRVSGPSPTART